MCLAACNSLCNLDNLGSQTHRQSLLVGRVSLRPSRPNHGLHPLRMCVTLYGLMPKLVQSGVRRSGPDANSKRSGTLRGSWLKRLTQSSRDCRSV